jgi:hypothetical protein
MIPTYAVLVVMVGGRLRYSGGATFGPRAGHPDAPAVFARAIRPVPMPLACVFAIPWPVASAAAFGLQSTFIIMSLIGLVGVGLALWLWPASDSSDTPTIIYRQIILTCANKQTEAGTVIP